MHFRIGTVHACIVTAIAEYYLRYHCTCAKGLLLQT